jgi:hemerythrin-like metal-binding protein
MKDQNNSNFSDKKELDNLIESYDRFVPHKIFELLGKKSVEEISLGDQVEAQLTILFSDIRNFTSLSESLTPKDNFDFINSYLSQMDEHLLTHNGIVDKFIGDSIMAIFPTDAEDAVDCSLAMIKQLESFNKQRKVDSKIPIHIGIGLNTGLCMLGIIGGSHKMEVTVISDAVNLASRLEGLTKKYGVQLLISENTLNNLRDINKYSFRFIDRVVVKGKSQPQSIYEVYDCDSSEIKNLKDQTKQMFEEALAHYHYKEIDIATEMLEKCLSLNLYDKPAKVYLERCKEFSKNGFHEGAKELSLQIKWSKEFEVGDAKIDEQHFELFSHSLKLLEAIDNGVGASETNNIISFLDNYVNEHFKTEEEYLIRNKYPFYEHQRAQHQNFIKSFELLKNEINSNKNSKIYLMFRIQTMLIDWVLNHTVKEDSHYSKYIKNSDNYIIT